MRIQRIVSLAVAALAALVLVAVVLGVLGASDEKNFSPYVDRDGAITLPENFRERMVHLGSWFVPAGDASGFHDVYTELRSVKAFQESGRFPDGATLVKELRLSRADTYTTGKGVSRATTDIKQWFVMIKDERGRFPGNPNWGQGWGWALFKPGDPKRNVSTHYQTDCMGCHVPAQANDWIYIEGYPTLDH